MYKELQQLKQITCNFENFQRKSIPLCAAENVISDFVKYPLSGDFQERYIMGSAYNYTINDFSPIGEAGQRTLNAMYQIINNANNSSEVQISNKVDIHKLQEGWGQGFCKAIWKADRIQLWLQPGRCRRTKVCPLCIPNNHDE